MRPVHLSALAFLLAASPLAAQRLAGTAWLPGGSTPAAGVIILAAYSAGREVAHTVTRAGGGFALFVDSTQALTFSALRVGHGPSPLFTRRLRDGESDSVRVVLADAPVALPSRVPRGAATCGGRDDGRAAVQALLAEARKVMVAARHRLGRDDEAARTVAFQHRTAKNGEDTLYTMMRRAEGPPPPLFDEVPAEELERRGFFATVAGERTYNVPGLETLTGDWFGETHCFTLSRVTDAEYVLTFKPARERKGLVDVEGEYRFDRPTAGLRRVTFRYVNLPQEERLSNSGGMIEFARLPNGAWTALQWHQRFPLLGYRSSSGNTTFVQSQMTLVDVIGHRVLGGRTTAVLAGDRPVFQHDPVPAAIARTPFGQLCAERLVTAQTAAARGRLVATDSLPVDRLVVRARWGVPVVVDRTQMTEREHVRETMTGPDGEWSLCDLPVDRDITISWSVRGVEGSAPLRIASPGTVVELPM
jgi:hypothetical protein